MRLSKKGSESPANVGNSGESKVSDTSPSTPNNPFSVKSTEFKNTQRNSTSFLDTMETTMREQETKRKSMQQNLMSLPNVSKSHVQVSLKPKKVSTVTKIKPAKPKKISGYQLWFQDQGDTSQAFSKAAPLKWRHLPSEIKEQWIQKAKEIENVEEKSEVTQKKNSASDEETSKDTLDKENERISEPQTNRDDSFVSTKRKISDCHDEVESPAQKKNSHSERLVSNNTKSKLESFQFKKKIKE